MGIEIPVPDIDWGTKESTLLPQFRPGTDYVGNPETAMEFKSSILMFAFFKQ